METTLETFVQGVVARLEGEGRYGTAHVYRSALRALHVFRPSLAFDDIGPELLKQFELHLRGRGCKWNTVSTYMRTLRAVYNRAVDSGAAVCRPRLFAHVYMGTRAECKRSLSRSEMGRLLKPVSRLPATLRRTCDLFRLMFLLRGIPFVDLAYLHKSDLQGRLLTYRRRKTGTMLQVSLTREALRLVHIYKCKDGQSPYLFPFLGRRTDAASAYREYQRALRLFNRSLGTLRRKLGIASLLSTYTARHTWATTAYRCEIHPGIISEAMGHSSISVTETYLKPFMAARLHEANRRVINSIKWG